MSSYKKRIIYWSKKTGLYPKRVTLRGQKTLWGSCSDDKKISLNWKLIAFHLKFIDYVIVHELCHIKEMSHSQKFWNLVEQYIPYYEEMKRDFKDAVYRVDFLNKDLRA